jgi:hypothetical protein
MYIKGPQLNLTGFFCRIRYAYMTACYWICRPPVVYTELTIRWLFVSERVIPPMSSEEPSPEAEPPEPADAAPDAPDGNADGEAPSPADEDSEGPIGPTGDEEDVGTELVEIELSPEERDRVIGELLGNQGRPSDPFDEL